MSAALCLNGLDIICRSSCEILVDSNGSTELVISLDCLVALVADVSVNHDLTICSIRIRRRIKDFLSKYGYGASAGSAYKANIIPACLHYVTEGKISVDVEVWKEIVSDVHAQLAHTSPSEQLVPTVPPPPTVGTKRKRNSTGQSDAVVLAGDHNVMSDWMWKRVAAPSLNRSATNEQLILQSANKSLEMKFQAYDSAPRSDLIDCLHIRESQIKYLRLQLAEQRRTNRIKENQLVGQKSALANPDEFLIVRHEANQHVTPVQMVTLAMRRNSANCAAYRLGAACLQDVSFQTVVKAELFAAAALTASMADFHREMESQASEGQLTFAVHAYGSDATVGKTSVLCMRLLSVYIDPGMVFANPHANFYDLCSMKSSWADVQNSPKKKGDVPGAAVYGALRKMLHGLGCPLATTFTGYGDNTGEADNRRVFRLELYSHDGGGDQHAYRKLRKTSRRVRRNLFHAVVGFDCHFHSYHCCYRDGFDVVNAWLQRKNTVGSTLVHSQCLCMCGGIWQGTFILLGLASLEFNEQMLAQ